MSNWAKCAVIFSLGPSILGCGPSPSADTPGITGSAFEAPGSLFPEGAETIYVFDQATLRAVQPGQQSPQTGSPALADGRSSAGCLATLGQRIDKAFSAIATGGPNNGFGMLLTTSDAPSVLRCIQASYAGRQSGDAWDLTATPYAARVSMLDRTTVLIASPRWHALMAGAQTGSVARTPPRVVDISQLLTAQSLVCTPPVSRTTDAALTGSNCQPIVAATAVVSTTNELATDNNVTPNLDSEKLQPSTFLTDGCQAAKAKTAYIAADARMQFADTALSAYIAFPYPSGTMFCAKAVNEVAFAAWGLWDAKDTLTSCPVSCASPFFPFPAAGVSAVLSDLRSYMDGVCDLAYLPLHNIIAGPIMLDRLRRTRIWTSTPASYVSFLDSCSAP